MFRRAIGGSICYWDSNLILVYFSFVSRVWQKQRGGNLFLKRGIVLSDPERFTNVVLSSMWNKNYAAENSHLGDILICLVRSDGYYHSSVLKNRGLLGISSSKNSCRICGLQKGSSDICSKRMLIGASIELVNFMMNFKVLDMSHLKSIFFWSKDIKQIIIFNK